MTLGLNRLLFLISSASVAIILLVLVSIAVDLAIPPSGTVGGHISYVKLAKTLIFLYGTMFAPGVLVAVVYMIYAPARFRGRPTSYALEIISIFVAMQTIITFNLLQDI